MDLKPGSRLGRYELLEIVGRGGMASVYKARHPSLGRILALKVIERSYSQDPEFIERFRREARAMAQLEHPNIVPVFDFDESDGHLFIAMQLLDGGTLARRISQARQDSRLLPMEESKRIGESVAAALDYAHSLGVIHRDVKPSNIMFSSRGVAVVTDFGIAKLTSATRVTRTGISVGTPDYMSPEQVEGHEIGSPSDLYSFAVVMYELLSGHPPFVADHPLRVMYAHARERPPAITTLRPDLPTAVDDVFDKALKKAPTDRFDSATDFMRSLGGALEPLKTSQAAATETKHIGPPQITARQDYLRDLANEPTRLKTPTPPLPVTAEVRRLGPRLVFAAIVAVSSIAVVTVAAGSNWGRLGGATALASRSPSPTGTTGATPAATPTATARAKTVKLVSSLPLQGASRTQTLQIINAIRMALDELGGKVGNVTVQYEALDDSTSARQSWDAAQEAENARRACADRSIVGYIGTFNSGAAKVAIPITNACMLAMVSPANTYPGLTKPIGEADEPDKYYRNGRRNYFRVTSADDIQGRVGANWAKQLGARRVYILHDSELYGKAIADEFRARAPSIGLVEAGYEAAPKLSDYSALVGRIRASGADTVYYGGIVDNNPAILLRQLRASIPSIRFIAPDGVACSEFARGAGSAAEGTYVTFGGIPSDRYTGRAAEWLQRYRQKYAAMPDVYAIYGYEAAQVFLDSIRRAGDRADDRATILDNVARTSMDSVFGTQAFDANGDTKLIQMSGLVWRGGRLEFVAALQ